MNKVRNAALVGAVALTPVLVPSVAFAQTEPTSDGVETAVSNGFGQLTSTLTGVLVPALFGLAVLGIVIALAIKYMRKGGRQA